MTKKSPFAVSVTLARKNVSFRSFLQKRKLIAFLLLLFRDRSKLPLQTKGIFFHVSPPSFFFNSYQCALGVIYTTRRNHVISDS